MYFKKQKDISKDYYPLRFMHWGSFLGYGLESARNSSENVISINFIELDANKEVLNENYDYMGLFKDSAGTDFSFGIRVML